MADDDDARTIHETTRGVAREVIEGRLKAHAKHGANSIEAVPGDDIARWLPILGEEVGEVCRALTYDQDPSGLRAELIDVATVAIAWVAALDRLPLPPCDCGSVDKHGDDIGEHDPTCPYHLAAVARWGALPGA